MVTRRRILESTRNKGLFNYKLRKVKLNPEFTHKDVRLSSY